MLVFAFSAAFVGFIHSLSPGHWLPVVLVARSKRWSMGMAIFGAFLAAAGHILLSIVLTVMGVEVAAKVLGNQESAIERYGALVLVAFGAVYAFFAWNSHSRCSHHTHHHAQSGSDLKMGRSSKKAALFFLFSLGFSPCVAVLPVFAAAAVHGTSALVGAMASFAVGVVAALVGASVLVVKGLLNLDHPLIEHYGDVITGLGVAGLGVFLYFVG